MGLPYSLFKSVLGPDLEDNDCKAQAREVKKQLALVLVFCCSIETWWKSKARRRHEKDVTLEEEEARDTPSIVTPHVSISFVIFHGA